MRLSPRLELRLAAFAGAALELAVDFAINGEASALLKAGALAGSSAFGGLLLAGAGLLTAMRFRPLTRRAAAVLAVGASAVFGMLLPPGLREAGF